MPLYLVQASYTSQALTTLVNNPADRTPIVRKSAEGLGGKLVGIWMSFGEQDIIALVEMPDNITAAAMSLAIAAGGSLKSSKTTPLFTFEEGLSALKMAARSGYIPVSAS